MFLDVSPDFAPMCPRALCRPIAASAARRYASQVVTRNSLFRAFVKSSRVGICSASCRTSWRRPRGTCARCSSPRRAAWRRTGWRGTTGTWSVFSQVDFQRGQNFLKISRMFLTVLLDFFTGVSGILTDRWISVSEPGQIGESPVYSLPPS